MRSSKSRSRSKANRPRTLGNIVNRVFDSSGPEGKVRGTPQQIIEKYQTLARDAQLSNDRVAAENFLQHAEHYTRLLAEAMREMAAEQEARMAQQAQQGGQGHWQNRQSDQRDIAPRLDLPGDGEQPNPGPEADEAGAAVVDVPETDRGPKRQEARSNRGSDNRNGDRANRPRDERPRDERPRDERPRDDGRKPAAKPQLRFEDGNAPEPTASPSAAAFESPADLVAKVTEKARQPKPRAPRARRETPATDKQPEDQG